MEIISSDTYNRGIRKYLTDVSIMLARTQTQMYFNLSIKCKCFINIFNKFGYICKLLKITKRDSFDSKAFRKHCL